MADLGTNLFDILWCESDGLRHDVAICVFLDFHLLNSIGLGILEKACRFVLQILFFCF